MKDQEKRLGGEGGVDTAGRRVGGLGTVEIGEDKRRWIYDEDVEGLQKMRERDKKAEEARREGKRVGYERIMRYDMVAKRIW